MCLMNKRTFEVSLQINPWWISSISESDYFVMVDSVGWCLIIIGLLFEINNALP